MFGNGIVRFVAVGALAASLATPTAETPSPHTAHAPDLEVAVQQSFADAPGGASGEPIVEPRDYTVGDTWAFGSGTTLEEGDPSMTLFVAQRVDGDWKVALEGSAAFASLAQKAPDDVIPRSEGEVLAETRPDAAGSSASILDPGLSLPWAKGESWRLGAGLHTNTGSGGGVRNSVDFSGEGSVRAPRDGVLYKSCPSATSALVKIVHDNGYSTTYYHMVDVTQVPDGTPITAGTPLGRIGNELPCGGHSTGAHVHFSLLKGNEPVSLDGVKMGGWVFRAGADNYQGWAEREGNRVGTGGRLENHGTDAPVTPPTSENPPTPEKPALSTGTVRAPNGNSVSLREAPRLDAPVVRTVQIGDTVQISCTARGDELTGYWGLSTDLWNQLPTGEWISDGFLDTGTTEPVAPACG